jgi:hypothetical protein
MSQSLPLSDLPDVVDSILNRIVEALTSNESMTQKRRDATARMIRTMVLGLFPADMMQLMAAGQAVLFHALTIDAAGDLVSGNMGDLKSKARSVVANMSRTMTRNLDALTRSQAHRAKDLPVPAAPERDHSKRDAKVSVKVEPELSQPAAGDVAVTQAPITQAPISQAPISQTPISHTPETNNQPAPLRPLNRQERRRAEREQARLARRKPADRTVTNAGGPGSVPGQ